MVISDLDYEVVVVYSTTNLPMKKKDSRVVGIYIIRNKISGKMYIGSSDDIARRFQAHLSQLKRGVHHSFILQNSWNFHAESDFEFIISEIFDSREGLIEREQELISFINPVFNIAACAENPMKGKRHSSESIEKMKVARTGKGTGPRMFSQEHRAALSLANKGRPSPHKGRKHSLASRKRMAEAALQLFSDGRINPRTRRVELFGIEYESGAKAAIALGISHTNVIHKIKRGFGRYLDAPKSKS